MLNYVKMKKNLWKILSTYEKAINQLSLSRHPGVLLGENLNGNPLEFVHTINKNNLVAANIKMD
jgi:hypothetical protein